ncbi:pre-rRNA processing, partial [Coemansia sp. RSA 2599]
TFTENLVFLLNRETDPATQVLILHMLNCILSDPGTANIIYTNDMHVLIDILLRDLSNLSESLQRQRQAYLLVVCALLRNPVYLAAKHRLSDIELCLVNMLRQSLVCLQTTTSNSVAGSRRGSVSSNSSTRHNSMASDVFVVPVIDIRRSGGTASPVSSLSSSMSEETCCPRSIDNSPSLGAVSTTPKRVAPPIPPPPSRSKLGQKSLGRTLGTLNPPVHRRRPAPPPPPLMAQTHRQNSPLPSVHPSEMIDGSNSSPRSYRRRAPPPPPPLPQQSLSVPPACARTAPTPSKTRAQSPPPPPPSQPALASSARHGKSKQAEQTGIRRQLSVKKSVSKYKRDSIRVAPLPPPRSRNSSLSSKAPMSPVIEAAAPAETASGVADNDDDNEDFDVQSLKSEYGDSAESRRITRKLVEGALRCCHEARITVSATNTPRW